MAKIIDCFLLHDEIELLEIRLRYLADTVDRFVVVTSSQTFTGRPKAALRLQLSSVVAKLWDRIQLIHLHELIGNDPWQRESYSRNALSRGLAECQDDDLIVISDIDELPRKSSLETVCKDGVGDGPVVLGLDYFNFKFNYQMIHGVQAVWAGPVISRYRDFTSPQQLREARWSLLDTGGRFVEDAGWHFSYLTTTGRLSSKLRSYSHQEQEVQKRGGDSVDLMIQQRVGFHDYVHAGAVWAAVDLKSLRCAELAKYISNYPQLLLSCSPDAPERVRACVRSSMRRVYDRERAKVLANCSGREIASEVLRRLRRKLSV